jgi:hypothetical protein
LSVLFYQQQDFVKCLGGVEKRGLFLISVSVIDENSVRNGSNLGNLKAQVAIA